MTEQSSIQDTIEKLIYQVERYPSVLGIELLVILKRHFNKQISKYLFTHKFLDNNPQMNLSNIDDTYYHDFGVDSQRFADLGQSIAIDIYKRRYSEIFGEYPIEMIVSCPSLNNSLSKKLKEDILRQVSNIETYINQAITHLSMRFDGDSR